MIMQTATTPKARRTARRSRRAALRAMRRPVPPIMLTLADGTRRAVRLCNVGPENMPGFECPFCHYPSTNRVPRCDNPQCATQLDAGALAARNAQHAAQEQAAREAAALQESLERSRTEAREAGQVRYDEAMAQARAAGQCTACLGRSLAHGGTRPKFTKHRDPANCPEARR